TLARNRNQPKREERPMKNQPKHLALSLVIASMVFGFSLCHAYAQQPVQAVAYFTSCTTTDVFGLATLTERPSAEGIKQVDISIIAFGLSEGKHAVHIHQTGACSPCSAANGHFDPGPSGNPNPDGNHPYHSGDLINLEVVGGVGLMQTTTNRVTLSP